MSTSNGTYVPVGHAARVFGVTPLTIRRWADAGRLASMRTLGGHRRVLLPAAAPHR